jgi:hypothetical protein
MRLLHVDGCEVCHIDPITCRMYGGIVGSIGVPNPWGTFESSISSVGPYLLEKQNGEIVSIIVTRVSRGVAAFYLPTG